MVIAVRRRLQGRGLRTGSSGLAARSGSCALTAPAPWVCKVGKSAGGEKGSLVRAGAPSCRKAPPARPPRPFSWARCPGKRESSREDRVLQGSRTLVPCGHEDRDLLQPPNASYSLDAQGAARGREGCWGQGAVFPGASDAPCLAHTDCWWRDRHRAPAGVAGSAATPAASSRARGRPAASGRGAARRRPSGAAGSR